MRVHCMHVGVRRQLGEVFPSSHLYVCSQVRLLNCLLPVENQLTIYCVTVSEIIQLVCLSESSPVLCYINYWIV